MKSQFIKPNQTLSIFKIAESIILDRTRGSSVFIINLCSNNFVFSGGLSKEICKFYPIVKTDFEVGAKFLGQVKIIKVMSGHLNQKLYVSNMIASDNKFNIKYSALIQCMLRMKDNIDKFIDANNSKDVQLHISGEAFPCPKNEFYFIKKIISDVWNNIPIRYY